MGKGWMISIHDTEKLKDREAFSQFLSKRGLSKGIEGFYYIDHWSSKDMEQTYDDLMSSFPELRFHEFYTAGPSPQMMMGNRSTSKGSVSHYRRHEGI